MKPFIFIIAIALSTSEAFANAKVIGNGGDAIGIEFEALFNQALKNIKDTEVSLLQEVAKIDFNKKLPKLTIMVVSQSLLSIVKGTTQTSTAINFPSEQLIKINRDKWNAIKSVHAKESLALHEMLSLLKMESSGDYRYSSTYASEFGLSDDDFSDDPIFKSFFNSSTKDFNQVLAMTLFDKFSSYEVESMKRGWAKDKNGNKGRAIFVKLSKPFKKNIYDICLTFIRDNEWKKEYQADCEESEVK